MLMLMQCKFKNASLTWGVTRPSRSNSDGVHRPHAWALSSFSINLPCSPLRSCRNSTSCPPLVSAYVLDLLVPASWQVWLLLASQLFFGFRTCTCRNSFFKNSVQYKKDNISLQFIRVILQDQGCGNH